jgi:hypothetical protein
MAPFVFGERSGRILVFNHTAPGSIAAHVSGTKRLHHPTLDTVCYEYASFQANDDPALRGGPESAS